MKKRILALVSLVLILVPTFANAAFTAPDDFTPDTVMVSGDFQLPADGRIRKLFDPFFLEMETSMGDDKSFETIFITFVKEQVKTGKKISVGFAYPQSVFLSIPASADQWTSITKDFADKMAEEGNPAAYNGTDIYTLDSDAYFARVGDFVLITMSLGDLEEAVDLAAGVQTNSLTSNAAYKSIVDGYLPSRFFSLTLNTAQLRTALKDIISDKGSSLKDTEQKGFNLFIEVLNLMSFEGMSVSENANGFQFTLHVKGNEQKLQEHSISFNPGGNFTPALYKQFGSAKPILYAESFNKRESYKQSKALLDKWLTQIESLSSPAQSDLQKMLNENLAKLYSVMTQESGFAIQYKTTSMLPYVTFMGNVASNKEAAASVADELATSIETKLVYANLPAGAYSKTTVGGFHRFTIDLTKLSKPYSWPGVDKLTFVLGVTPDGLLIFSNYPGIESAETRTGFASDADFSPSLTEEFKTPLTSVLYLNMRNLWGYTDSLFALIDTLSQKDQISLNEYRAYYSLLDQVYGWKDFIAVSRATTSDAVITGQITIDEKTHLSYDSFISAMKSADTDKDSVNDYEERYVYHTSVTSSDFDADGVSDIEELKKGENPLGSGKLFTDLPSDAYYTKDVAFLSQQGAIGGYADKSVKPGRLVNRAEFTTIVIKAFGEENNSAFDLSDLDPTNFINSYSFRANEYNPFSDVSQGKWYYKPIVEAYRLGWVSGNYGNPGKGEYYSRIFRPADSITRAEAITILNRASATLQKTRWENTCLYESSPSAMAKTPAPFSDVSTTDWFCDAVQNAYVNGLTKGKEPNAFKPQDPMTRAEAAVMIRRAFEKDLGVAGE